MDSTSLRFCKSSSNSNFFQHAKPLAFCTSVGPIQGRILAICDSKNELSKQWLSCQNDYFDNVTKQSSQPNDGIHIRCDECICDPTIPMRTPPTEHKNLIYQGMSRDGNGAKGYLRVRYNSGLPETRFCYPPTSNLEYGWKLQENAQRTDLTTLGTRAPSTVGMASFRRKEGAKYCINPPKSEIANFRFPRFYS